MTHGIYTDFFNKSLPMPTEGPSDADEAAALLGEADFNLLMLGALKFCRPPVYSR